MKSLADLLWALVRWVAPLAVAAVVVGVVLGSNRLGEELRRRVESRLRTRFPALDVRVQSAALIEGEGIVIRGLAIADPSLPADQRRLVWVDEMRVACGTTLAELAAGEPRVTAVRVSRPVVHACRGPDGGWTLARLTAGGGGRLDMPVTVDDATLILEGTGLASRLTLRNIAIELTPAPASAGDPCLAVRGSVVADVFERAGFEGTLTSQGEFSVGGTMAAVDVSPRLHGILDADCPAAVAGLRGRLDLEWRASGRLAAVEAASFRATGRLTAGRFEHPSLPFAVSDLSASFTADPAGIELERLEGHSGSTLLRGAGRMSGWSTDADFDVVLEAERMLVGRHWEGFMPPQVASQWSKLLPAGEVDVRAHLVRSGGAVRPDVSLRCRSVSLTYYRFPYRVDRTVGTVTLKDDTLTMHLAGEAGGHAVRVDAVLGTAGEPRGFLEVRGDGMRIDDALLAAMPARSADIVRSLRGEGTFDFVFRHERSPRFAGGHANSLGIRLTQCSLAYAGFPYPLSNVNGSIEMQRGRWTIREITGCNDSGVVRCTGTLERIGDDDGELLLHLAGNDVVLERELRDALPPGMRRIWDDIDPRGSAGFTAVVRHRVKTRSTEVELQAAPRGDTVSIEPVWFPYRLERLQGRLAWKDGVLRFDDVRGAHARTTVSAEGTCRFTPDGGWHVSFARLAADRFRADHEVLEALPAGLRRAVAAVRMRGMLSVDGAIEIHSTAPTMVAGRAGRMEPVPGPAAAAWDIQLDMEQAAIDVGVPLEHVHGGIRLRGQGDGRSWRTAGDVAIDSAMLRGVQMTAIRGPLAMDGAGVRFGRPAETGVASSAPLTAQVAGGTVLADGTVEAGGGGAFAVGATLADADLERLAGDIAAGPHRFRGRVLGKLELRGSRAGTHSLVGGGHLRLRDADIYELPVMVALLKILRVRPPDRRAFTSSLVEFRVEGPHAYLDTIELSGDAISLVGAGEIDFDSNVKLAFRPIMGEAESQLPALKRLLGGASGQFVLVHVDGTLADPVTTTEAFPTLAAAVQRLQAQRGTEGGVAARRDESVAR